MYTSVILVALAGGAAAAEEPQAVKWQPSYAAARQEGRRGGKPVAVFVGNGPEGWKGLSGNQALTPQAIRALNDDYVCVYADTARPEGRQLASALAIDVGPGLVLSTRDGAGQAFYHDGEMAGADLESSLSKYAETARAVNQTETLGTTATRASITPGPAAVLGSPFAPGYAPAQAPVQFAPANFGGFSGGLGGRSAGC